MAIRLEMKIQFLQDASGHRLNIFKDCQDCEQFLWDSKGRQPQKPGPIPVFMAVPIPAILAARPVLSPLPFLPDSLPFSPQPGSTLSSTHPSFVPVTTGATADPHGSGPSRHQKLHATQGTWDFHNLLKPHSWIITKSHWLFMLDDTTNGNLPKYKFCVLR